MQDFDRRSVLGGGLVALAGCASARAPVPDVTPELAAIRDRIGGRLGIAALDTGSGRRIGFDAETRYAMASTFKVPLAAAILAEVDRGRLALDRQVALPQSDLVTYSPVVAANQSKGELPVETLAAAIVKVSDNGAANLLLDLIGGPAGLTAFMRNAGDAVTRLDRMETALNENLPGDQRDTTTPAAMVGLLDRLLLGPVLSEASRTRLIGWMEASRTGRARLRAGLPAGWRAGDKTGTGARGAVNDIAIAWPPGRAPILIASYMSGSIKPVDELNAAHAEVARIVARALG